ncbi:S9 family peptidase [Sphingomonas parva]|uniref:S9 family peptidase n=1 Tax=Sphingomonas parva TaxID=2555898 RepID=A0A4Y8ZTN5_9SPHN|nr:prolyl oligopeptidase family serine peptidase [Sphingomonas parva]TFI57826.1 S9 family peptidase [Sphingomonas parva]
MQTLRTGLVPLLCLTFLFASSGAGAAPAALAPQLAAERARAAAPVLPRDAFLAPSSLADFRLSPKGKAVAYLRVPPRGQAGGNGLWLLEAGGGAARRLLRSTDAATLYWSADGEWLFLESGRGLSALPLRSARGSGMMTLLGRESGRDVLGADPIVPAAMLVRERVFRPGSSRIASWRLLRFVPGRRPELLLHAGREIADVALGRDGRPAFVRIVEPDHFSIRRVGGGAPAREVLRCERLATCGLLSSPAAGESLLAGDVGAGRKRLALLDRQGRVREVNGDAEADLDEAVLDPATGRALFAAYRSTTASLVALSGDAAHHLQALRARFGARDLHLTVGRGPGARWLVAETGDRLQHPRWHLYDPATGATREILAEEQLKARQVPEAAAARRIPFDYRASDGLTLHGFISIPPGRDLRRVPLVVAVHGGPWAKLPPGFVRMTQVLANRGYAVFEPAFRGSMGFGRAYTAAGGSDFGNGRVQQDIVEGTRFLLAQGVGDPRRVAITGVSFGGYATLLGLTFQPDLFKIGVAAMPPPDFGWNIAWQIGRPPRGAANGIPLAVTLPFLGLDPADRAAIARLRAQSPVANARRLSRPLLIVAGGADETVPVRSVLDYAARLKRLGKPVRLYVDPRSGHRLDRPDAQETFLYLMEQSFGRAFGIEVTAPSATTRRALAANLRISGHPPR